MIIIHQGLQGHLTQMITQLTDRLLKMGIEDDLQPDLLFVSIHQSVT